MPDNAWIELPPANAELRYHGVDTNMSRLIAAHPRIGERFGALFLETMFGEGVLAYEERELVAGGCTSGSADHGSQPSGWLSGAKTRVKVRYPGDRVTPVPGRHSPDG